LIIVKYKETIKVFSDNKILKILKENTINLYEIIVTVNINKYKLNLTKNNMQ